MTDHRLAWIAVLLAITVLLVVMMRACHGLLN